MSLSPILEVESSESIVLHLPVAYDKTPKLIAICNDDYKFAAFSHSILQEFVVVNEVTGMFHPEIVGTFHTRRTSTYKIMRRIAFITDQLDILWDPSIGPTFSGEHSTCSVAYAFSVLPSPTAQKSVTSTTLVPPGCTFVDPMVPSWPIENHGRSALNRIKFSPTPGE